MTTAERFVCLVQIALTREAATGIHGRKYLMDLLNDAIDLAHLVPDAPTVGYGDTDSEYWVVTCAEEWLAWSLEHPTAETPEWLVSAHNRACGAG